MKRKKFAMVLLTLALVLAFFKVAIRNVESNGYIGGYGVAYSSSGWDYTESNATLDIDLGRLNDSNIRIICPWLHWRDIEPSKGSYSTTFLDNIMRLIQKADEYNIEVDIDFHTGSGASKTYGLPSWFRNSPYNYDFDDVALNTGGCRQWLIDAQNYTVNYLDDEPNIRSYHLLNEWYCRPQDTNPDQSDYETLIQALYDAINPETTRPIGFRMGPYGMVSYNWIDSETLWSCSDIACLNIYIGLYGGHTLANLDTWVNECNSRSKPMTITEYGWDSANDDTHNSSIASQIAEFKARGIEYTQVTQYGRVSTSPFFEILSEVSTPKWQPRPAYYELEKANYDPQSPAPTEAYFGTTSQYTSAADVDDAVRGCRFNVTSGSGYATSITVYLRGANTYGYEGNMTAALYNTLDYSLIGGTDEQLVTLTQSFEWVQFNFSSPYPNVNNNTEYIIVCFGNETGGDEGVYVGRTASGAGVDQSIRMTADYDSGLPDPLTSVSEAQYITSMYCNFTIYETETYWTLTMESTTGGTIIPTVGAHSYLNDTTAYLIATESDGYTFAAWEVDEVNVTTSENEWSVIITANTTAKAYFSLDLPEAFSGFGSYWGGWWD